MAGSNGIGRLAWRVGSLLAVLLVAGGVSVAALSKTGKRLPATTERPAPAHGAPCPRAGPPLRNRSNLVVGMNSVWMRGCDLSRLASSGVAWARVEFDVGRIAQRPGRNSWSYYDKRVGLAARAGVTVLPLVIGNPRWSGRRWNVIPENPSDFAAVTGAVARRYGPGGGFWRAHRGLPYRPAGWVELWNEPYLPSFSADGIHPDRYAQLVKAAAIAGRRANPKVKFLLAADTTPPSGGSVPWIAGMYGAVPDLNSYFDAVAIHPYSGTMSPGKFTPTGDTSVQFGRVALIHAEFTAHQAAAKLFWITEIGWSTCPDAGSGCVSERVQDRYITEVFGLVRSSYPFIRAVFVYNYRDDASDPSNKEDWFGVFRSDGRAKPAWRGLRRAILAG